MTEDPDKPAIEHGAERPRATRLLQGLIIIAIMALIVIALVSFR